MAERRTLSQGDMLRYLATYRLLTADQLALLRDITLRGARKGLSKLEGLGFIEARQVAYGQARGRPARAYSLSHKGIHHLKESDPDWEGVPLDLWRDEAASAHQLLLNWFLLHVLHLPQALPQLEVQMLNDALALPMVSPEVRPASSIAVPGGTIPDAIFAIPCEEQGKTLLFFVEIDRDTESLASPTRGSRAFRDKILHYQQLFRSGMYRRYEIPLQCNLRGFRLLVLTLSPRRLAGLCRLTRQTPPSDFIWLTDQASLFREGLAAAVWARGGRPDIPRRSIVGPTYARVALLPPAKA